MQNNTEKQGGFKKAFYSFHKAVRASIKREVQEYTGWSHKTFYNKLNGTTIMSPAEAAVIGYLFTEMGVCAWTGEEVEALRNAWVRE